MTLSRSSSSARLAVCLLLTACLTGCGTDITPIPVSPVTPAPPAPVTGSYPGSAFAGQVLSGSVPVIGASVQLYAAGTSGNRQAAGALLSAPVVTDATGAFTISASYTCPLATTPVYLVARGGTAASASSQPNAALALLTAAGPCNQIAATSRFVVNEATTVSAAWALAQFLGPAGIGASSTNTTGLANAFRLAAGLTAPTTGLSPGPTLSGTVTSPAARIHALANLLNTCARGDGATTAASPCGQLFAATTISGSSPPSDTLATAIAIVQNPATNVSTLYTLSLASTAFTPTLATVPSDWTLALTLTGGGMNGPTTVGVLSTGNVWVSNYFDVASSFTPLGAPVFPSGITGSGLDHSYGMAVDAADNAWIANEDKSTITELAAYGMALSGASGYAAGGIDFPIAVAIDPDSSVWVVDYGNAHLTRLGAGGTPLSGSAGYASGQLAFPAAIAIDTTHHAWIANSEGTTLTRVSQDGTDIQSAACCNGPDGVAIDQRGFVWVSNFYGNSVSLVSSSLGVISSGYTAAALNRPQGIAVDGAGNLWVSSFRGPGVVELAGTQATSPGLVLSPPAGWARDTPLSGAYSLAIDASGNLWVASFGNSTLTEILGLASPVKTPTIGPPQAP